MNNYLLGDYVKKRRKNMGLSLRDFGKLCGISHTTIDVIERGVDPRNGKPVNITNSTFEKLAIGLGEPIEKLVGLSKGTPDIGQNETLKSTKYYELNEENKAIIDQMIEKLIKSQFDD